MHQRLYGMQIRRKGYEVYSKVNSDGQDIDILCFVHLGDDKIKGRYISIHR